MSETPKESADIVELMTQIIAHLQQNNSLREEKLKAVFSQLEDGQGVPASLKPRNKESWYKLLFKDNWNNVRKNGVPASYRQRLEIVLKALDILPPTASRGERLWSEYMTEMLKEVRAASSSAAPVGKTSNDVAAALKLLFGLKPDHYSVNGAMAGEYFGYRLSSNLGRIIRFHIKIDPPTNGVLTFTNHYRQHSDKWDVTGCGVDVDGLTYLMGSAQAAGDEDTGLGLRFFVLKKFRSFGWRVGLLSTLDRLQNPIAARIVLVPVHQHKSMKVVDKSEHFDKVLELISNKAITDDDLNDIEVADARQLNGLPISTLIRTLIWNGTLRTVHGANIYVPDKEDAEAYNHVFAFQEHGLNTHPPGTNDIQFFSELLAFDDVRSVVMKRLSPGKSTD